MAEILKHIQLLGLRVQDRVTGLKGVVTSVTFDLYGCIQAIVNPGVDSSGKIGEQNWFDVNRLLVLDTNRVMPVPEFEWSAKTISSGGKGPAERPRMIKP